MEIFNNPDEKKVRKLSRLLCFLFQHAKNLSYLFIYRFQVAQVEAQSLYKEFYKLETAILLEFWCRILHKANGVSKSLQNPEIDIRTTVCLYKSLTSYIQNMRSEESFSQMEENSKNLIRSCSEWKQENDQLSYNCYNARQVKRNTRYDSGNCPDTFFDDSKNFRVKIFYPTLDILTTELQSRSKSYENTLQPFNFLFHLDVDRDVDIRKEAANLTKIYSTDLDKDFIEECIHFKFFVDEINREVDKDDECYYFETESFNETTDASEIQSKKLRVSKPAKMLQYIKKHKIESTFPNLEIALRIFECIAVANCSGERSFSALKRVKNFHRSTTKQKKTE